VHRTFAKFSYPAPLVSSSISESAVAKLVFNRDGVRQLMNDAGMDRLLFGIGQQVQAEAEATAQNAQRGPGGTIAGYAEAGFSLTVEELGDRPVAIIASKAQPEVAWAAHYYTQKRDGVGHLRKALYKFTRRGA